MFLKKNFVKKYLISYCINFHSEDHESCFYKYSSLFLCQPDFLLCVLFCCRWNFLGRNEPVRSTYSWHALPVMDLQFTAEGQ